MLRLIIVKRKINNRILQQIQLLVVHAVLLSTPEFHSTGRHYIKNFALKNYTLLSLLWNKCDSAEVLTGQA